MLNIMLIGTLSTKVEIAITSVNINTFKMVNKNEFKKINFTKYR